MDGKKVDNTERMSETTTCLVQISLLRASTIDNLRLYEDSLTEGTKMRNEKEDEEGKEEEWKALKKVILCLL